MKSIQFPPADGRGKHPFRRGAGALAALGLLVLGSAATAQTVSVNFVGGNGPTTPTPMDPTEVAGVVPVPNWNNAAGANAPGGTPMSLVDSTGAATALTVDWEGSPGTYSSGIPNTPGNFRMMVGYLDQGGGPPYTTTTVTVAGLNAATTYGVYVYASGDVPGRVGMYTIGSQTYYLTNNSTFNGAFTQVTSTVPTTNPSTAGVGNYMIFTVSGKTTFTLSATPTNFRSPVNAIQIVNLSVVPAAPTALTALGTNNLVSLNWSGSAGALTYNVYRGTTAGGESATPLATGVNGTSYQDATAVNGTTYYYTVKAVNSVGVSGPSNEASAKPVPAVIGSGTGLEGLYYNMDAGDYSSENGPVIFSNLASTVNYNHGNNTSFNPTDWPSGLIAANGGTSDHFTAVWSGMFLAPYTGPYQFQSISDDGSRFSVDTGSGLQQQFTDNAIHGPVAFTSPVLNLTAGQKYPIKLEYLNDFGGYTEQLLYNPVGQGFQIIPQTQLFPAFPAAPAAVTNLSALGASKSVTLNWTGSLYAATYNIYRGTTPGGENATPIATGVTANTYTDSGLTNGVTYYYYIVAVNSVGSSAPSNEASAVPNTPFIGNGDGLYGTYYGGADTGYIAETGTPIGFGIVPTINFNAGNGGVGNNPGAFPSSLPGSNFTAVWTGLFLAPVTASYTFQINSDDGSRLSLGTDATTGSLTQVVDNSNFQGPTARNTAPINLIGGQKYSIKMEYFQGGGGETAQLLYSIAGGTFTIIPQTQLFSNVTTPPAQVIDLTAVPYSNSIHLYWTNVAGAVTYNVYRGTTPGGESATPIATGLTGAPYIDNTAVNGVTYYYTVAGVNIGGIGPASNEASATPVNVVSAVAFWRFEEGTAGMAVAPGVQLPDSAGHGNTLQTPDANAAPTYSSNVPGSPTTPPLSNLRSVDFTALPGTGFVARELNTGGATGDINTHAFSQMTVEASFNVAAIGGYQTFVGREGMNYPGDPTGGNADFYLELLDPNTTNGVQILSARAHETSDGALIICNGTTTIQAGQWYNAAAVADGHSLSLYLQTTPNGAYHLENSVPFNGAVGNQGTRWTVGRGFYGGNPTDRYNGLVDEVRISDNALAASQFLFAPVAGATVTGRVSLEGVPDLSAINPHAPLGTFHVTFRNASTGAVVKATDVTLATTAGSATGTFSVFGVPAGTYNVLIKGMKNLAVLTPNVVVSATSGTIPAVMLPAGDSNNDNFVDSSDFGTLIGAFNTDSAISGSGYDPTVDFNFDGVIDSSDFGLLIGEFNNVGAQ